METKLKSKKLLIKILTSVFKNTMGPKNAKINVPHGLFQAIKRFSRAYNKIHSNIITDI